MPLRLSEGVDLFGWEKRLMGKKKEMKKTKELSVGIGEASSEGDAIQQQPLTPRKRGRPRKEQPAETAQEVIVKFSESKKLKAREEAEQQEDASSLTMGDKKEEGKSEEELPREPRRSRVRRKGKPQKSS